MPNANLRILVPESTTNYILNPSLRNDTTGWTAAGATMTRSLEQARFGIASLKMVTAGSALNEGAYYRVNGLSGIQDVITVSIYVRGSGKVRIRLIDNPRGAQWASQPIALKSTRWTRLEVTGRCTGSNDMRLYVETADTTPKAITFYADAAQMERKPYATTFCDGTQPGCRWNIVADATISTRDPYTRLGGRWVALAGPCRADDDIYVTSIGGMGMPAISNNTQSYAQAPGSYFQNSKVNARVITLGFNVKNKSLRKAFNPSLAALHELRQQLIDLFKPDKGRGDEEFILEYTDGDYPIYLAVRYEAGLEGAWDIRNQWVNSFPVRFLAVSPMFWEDDQEVGSMSFSQSLGILGFFAARVGGVWTNMNYGSNAGTTGTMAFGKNGEIYATVGTVVNNSVAALQPLVTANYIAKWNGSYFEALGSGANAGVRGVAVSPNGNVYVCGAFTSIGGVAANYVAYWNGTSWNAMGTGLNADTYTIAVAPNGDVYVGGLFTTAGGITAKYVAKWNGTSWVSMGAYAGLDNNARAIVISPDGTSVYVGGAFAREFGGVGALIDHIAKYDPVLNTFSALGSGLDSTVLEIAISPKSGIIYACGDFTLSGSVSVPHIAQWNGSQWLPVGSGFNFAVYGLAVSNNENLLAVGRFTLAGSVAARSLALWNGSSWTPFDIDISHGGANIPELWTAVFSENGDIYVSGQLYINSNSSNSSAINLVTNVGSAEVPPTIYIKGPGTLRWLENQTTGKIMYMDLDILSNEEVTIDFGKAKISSQIRGDLSYGILPGSDFKSWKLAPGENRIAAFMVDDVGAIMQIRYTPTHYSADATMRGLEMV